MKKKNLLVVLVLVFLATSVLYLSGLTRQRSEADVINDLRIQMDQPVQVSVETDEDRENILWLARVIYSETKRENEMPSIGWVVRNRVETGYMGNTYREVATRPYQFSGLNSFDNHYRHNISRTWESTGRKWRAALDVARNIYRAHAYERPFAKTVRHFYSPVAISRPDWANGRRPVREIRSEIDPAYVRFAFYDRIR